MRKTLTNKILGSASLRSLSKDDRKKTKILLSFSGLTRESKFQKRLPGFSLLELALVLVIIGLIAGAIFKGKDLLETARVRHLSHQLQSYKMSILSFHEQFSSLPGDFPKATQLSPTLRNGNGDGLVSGAPFDISSEAGQFWLHLQAADLTPEIGLVTGGHISFGAGAPTTKLGGGITAQSSPHTWQGALPGLWLIVGDRVGDANHGALLTPAQAYRVDKELDDGGPLSGDVRATEGQGISAGKCVMSGQYNLAEKSPTCILLYRVL